MIASAEVARWSSTSFIPNSHTATLAAAGAHDAAMAQIHIQNALMRAVAHLWAELTGFVNGFRR